MKFTTKLLLPLTLSVLMASCCPCGKRKSNNYEAIIGEKWQMIQHQGSTFTANDGYYVTFTDSGKISGKGDCNRLMGSFTKNNGKIEISKMASGRMMCQDQTMENKFMSTLEKADAYTIDGELLSLFSNSELIAIFEITEVKK